MTDQPYRVTWFAPDRPVDGVTMFVRPDPGPDLAEAERVVRTAAKHDVPQPPAQLRRILLAEYDRRGEALARLQAACSLREAHEGTDNGKFTIHAIRELIRGFSGVVAARSSRSVVDLPVHAASEAVRDPYAKDDADAGEADIDHWRTRALMAEDRVDGQAWVDLEAERDRLRVELADAQALIDAREDEVNSVRMQAGAALSSSEAPTPPAPWDQTVAHPAAWRAAHNAGGRAYRNYETDGAAPLDGAITAAVIAYMDTVQTFRQREQDGGAP